MKESEEIVDDTESYKPQKSIIPSQSSFMKAKSITPSKPIRSQKQVIPLNNNKNKKTIFEKDTTYNKYNYSQQPKKAQRKSPLNHIVDLQKPYKSNNYNLNSGFSSNERTQKDPYGEVIDYSNLDKNDDPKSVSFLNFVDKMAKRNSIKNRNKYNLKTKNNNPMANSNYIFYF